MKKLEEYDALLKSANGFYRERKKTIFEITKYPYREVISSNILSFYFNINEEHGMGDLFIKALIHCINDKINNKNEIKIDEKNDIEDLNVYTESHTDDGKSIDLLLSNEDFAIGIENKLCANLYNPLNEYAKHIDAINMINYKVVISIKEVIVENTSTYDNSNLNDSRNYEFINVLYKDFFEEVKKLLEERNLKDNKWKIFLNDFIETINRSEVDYKMNEEICNWYEENEKNINNFLNFLLDINNMAYNKAINLGKELRKVFNARDDELKKYTDRIGCYPREYSKDKFCYNKKDVSINSWICNIINIPFDDRYLITIDNVFKLNKWNIQIRVEKGAKDSVKSKLRKMFENNGIKCKDVNDRHIGVLKDFPDNDGSYEGLIKMNMKVLKLIESHNSK